MKTSSGGSNFFMQPIVAVPIFLGATVFVFVSISRLVNNGFHGFDTSDWIRNLLLFLVFSTYTIMYLKRKKHAKT